LCSLVVGSATYSAPAFLFGAAAYFLPLPFGQLMITPSSLRYAGGRPQACGRLLAHQPRHSWMEPKASSNCGVSCPQVKKRRGSLLIPRSSDTAMFVMLAARAGKGSIDWCRTLRFIDSVALSYSHYSPLSAKDSRSSFRQSCQQVNDRPRG